VASTSQRSEELKIYNLIANLTISNHGLKVVSSNVPPGSMVGFFFVDNQGFLREGVKT
jgi:hypothetical protein